MITNEVIPENLVVTNQKFIVVATLRMVGNRWLWSIMLGNANEAENLELVIVDYPRNFLSWKLNHKQRWSSSAFPSVPNMFVKVVGIKAIFDDSQLLAGYHWHFHAYPINLSVMQLNIVWILKTNAHTHTHARTRTSAGDNLQYNISTEWNILKCDFKILYCTLWFAYPTIMLELKSKTVFGTHGHKEQFYSSKVCSD